MKNKTAIAVAILSLVLGTFLPAHAQEIVQSLQVNLVIYDAAGRGTITIGTSQLIRHFTGSNVHNGRLLLVTPAGNAPGEIGNLNAFLRIKRGSETVLEIHSPTEFNIYQDVAPLRPGGTPRFIRAVNRFSIDSGSIRAELQGIGLWSVPRRTVNGVNVSGTGSFQCSVNGWISIFNVTQSDVPVRGVIIAGQPHVGS
jgi:hypothetical protein